MMKRAYIKPDMEILDGELTSILCSSYNANFDNQKIYENTGSEDDIPTGGGARGFDDDFGFDE